MKTCNKIVHTLAIALSVVLLVTGCAQTSVSSGPQASASTTAGASDNASSSTAPVKMTDVGTPRAETLIMDMVFGRATDPTQMNSYLPGALNPAYGFRQCIWEPLWELDTTKGEQYPLLAETMAEPMDDTFTKFKVKLRQGVKWSDGVDFTADDVVFTSDMILNTPELTYSSAFKNIVKSITALDKYTIQIETVSEQKRIEQSLGVIGSGTNFNIVPKHIWENVDPKTYKNEKAIGTGPYILKDVDPNGNWLLYERRADCDKSATSILFGEPAPKYVEWRCYGTEEKRIMAASQNDLDTLCDITFESWQVLKAKNPEAMNWTSDFPYGSVDPAGPYTIVLNCMAAPLDDADVRWALTLALDMKSILLSACSGIVKVSPLAICPTDAFVEAYETPLQDWIKDFALPDGYKPFDANFTENLVATLKAQGIEGLPTDEKGMKNAFGIGWWKYDTSQAEKMLLEKGFTRDSKGMWLKPDNTPFKITISNPSGFNVLLERQGYLVADYWQKFGIETVIQPVDAAAFQTTMAQGTADCFMAWPNLSALTDTTVALYNWHSDNMTPIGENIRTSYNTLTSARWANKDIDEMTSKIMSLKADDPAGIELRRDFYKLVATNMPSIFVTGVNHLVPTMNHYWTGFQDAENDYAGPLWWWSGTRVTFAKIKPTGNQ